MIKDNKKKICVVGDSKTGITSLIKAFIDKKVPDDRYTPISSVTFKLDDTEFLVSLHDTSSENEYDRLRPLSYPNTDVFLVLFSVESRDSMENVLERWVPEIKDFCPKTPFVLVCSKIDLRNKQASESQRRVITEQEGKNLAEKSNAHAYIECSAVTLYNIDNVFEVALTTSTMQEKSHRKQSCSFI